MSRPCFRKSIRVERIKTKAYVIFTLMIPMVFSSLGISLANASSPEKWIETCTSTSGVKDGFYPPEDVYLIGDISPWEIWVPGADSAIWYLDGDLYIFSDRTWIGGESLSTGYVVKATVTLTFTIPYPYPSCSARISPPQLIWEHPLEVGRYDVVLDLVTDIGYAAYGPDGVYDPDLGDLIDDLDVNGAGFFVIPEVPFGSAMVLLAALASLLWKRKLL